MARPFPRQLRKSAIVVAILACTVTPLLRPAPAGATGSTTTSVTPSAQVLNNCFFVVTQPSQLTYDPIVAQATSPLTQSSGSISIKCTKNDTVTLDFVTASTNWSQYGTSGIYQPRMTDGAADYLNYYFYQDSGYTKLWGTKIGTTQTAVGTALPLTGTGNAGIFPFYFSVPAAQIVPAGSYTDSVTLTINY